MTADSLILLTRHFGFDQFRPGQAAVIEALADHNAALAVFPTGGGKSLCYQLPALTYDGVTLVVSPLIALMKDQIDFLVGRGVAAARLDSSLSAAESRSVFDRMRDGSLKLLYVAPERFNNERFLAQLRHIPIALFAVDEAHCISEWGHNFRPDYLKLADVARDLQVARVLALTATAPPAVVRDICAAFRIPDAAAIVTGFYRPNLNFSVAAVRGDERDALLLKRLQTRKPGSGIVYVTLQKTAERVAAFLRANGFPAEAYHAGMETADRERVQEAWKASDRGIVAATIAFGMGIDKSNVRYVYHYNLPKSLESYCQEIGRAGRDGVKSTVELLACADDVPTLENFAYGDTPTEAALHSLTRELLNRGETFDVSLYDLSARHDLRPLVLRTALTYLELEGALRQGTPFYAGYEFRPLVDKEQIVAAFPGEPGRLVASLFAKAKKGRTWFAVNPDTMAETLGQERRRIVRALEVMEERRFIELKLSDIRQSYTRLAGPERAAEFADDLAKRFLKREAQEIKRVGQVLDLIQGDVCLTNALIGYFGEERTEPCGHCSVCVTGKAMRLPEPLPLPPLPAGLDTASFNALRREKPEALGEARQSARFLCGLSSPALTAAKLGRHEWFGIWEARRFGDVMAWAEQAQ